jgi:hypothetical protein
MVLAENASPELLRSKTTTTVPFLLQISVAFGPSAPGGEGEVE